MTTTPEGLPAWLHVGAEVGTYRRANRGAFELRETTIERFTKTLAVLADGKRFSIRNVNPDATRLIDYGQGSWSIATYLVPVDSDEWRAARREVDAQIRRSVARHAVEEWERRPSDETARAAITALEATLTTTETPS